MPTVGSTLSAERVRQGLDLNDIARVTKLSLRAVQAIEADDFEQLPGIVFARNFVRQFAEALGLDPAAISRQFEREQSVPVTDFAASRPSDAFMPELVSKPDRSLGSGSFFGSDAFSAFATFVFTLILCGVAFWGFQYWRSHKAVPEPAKQARVEPALSKNQAPPAAAQPDAQPTPPVAPVALGSANSNSGSPASVHVDLTATESCWTRITADGKLLFAGTLQPGDTRTIDAASVVTIRAGNAAALTLKLNGNGVPTLGPAGQIRAVTLTQAGAQVRTPSPELLSDF